MSKLKNWRKRWCTFYTINCWGPTTRDIGIPASYSPLSWSNPKWLLTSLENLLVMKNAPLWGQPSTSPFEAVLLSTVNSRQNARTDLCMAQGDELHRSEIQTWAKRLWHCFIFVAELSKLGFLLFLFPLDKLGILLQVPLLLSTPMSHNCLLGHWKDSSLGIILKCSRGGMSLAPFTS